MNKYQFYVDLLQWYINDNDRKVCFTIMKF